MGKQDGTIYNDMAGVSGNDLPGDEAAAGENGTGDPVEPAEPVEPEGPAEGNEQEPGNDTSDPGEEEQETQPVVVIEDGDSKEWREDITQRLAEMMKPEDTTDVTERLDALIGLLTSDELSEGEPEADAQAAPVEGYEGFSYPVKVEYAVLFAGYEEYITDTETYGDPETFRADYEDFVAECSRPGSNFKDFYVRYVYDSGNSLVYDCKSQMPEPEPDPGDEEEKETVELLLSHLEGINTTLSGMVQADAEYYQMVKDYQAEMLEMQSLSTATDIFICIGVFAVFGALVFWQFLGRFK